MIMPPFHGALPNSSIHYAGDSARDPNQYVPFVIAGLQSPAANGKLMFIAFKLDEPGR